MRSFIAAVGAALLLLPLQPADSQAPAPLAYADLADLALAAPVVAHVRLDKAERLGAREAPNVRPGHRRFLVTASVLTLIRGEGGLPARITFLADLPDDARGRPARLARRSEHLLLAQRVAGRPGELRLAAPDSFLPFDPETAARLRAILAEVVAPDAPPAITAIGRAFHVRGSLPGESETQIFLQTADRRPVSLIVLRRPGERTRWSAAFGEMVDDNEGAPAPETLLWYRLACFLPQGLPASALAEASPEEAEAIGRDYGFVRESLGPCARRRSAG